MGSMGGGIYDLFVGQFESEMLRRRVYDMHHIGSKSDCLRQG